MVNAFDHSASHAAALARLRALSMALSMVALFGCASAPVPGKPGAGPSAAPVPAATAIPGSGPPQPAEQAAAPAPPAKPAEALLPPPPVELAGSIHAALEALDAGQEDVAETEIRRLLQAEPQARLARSLLRQIKEDPLTVIGQGRESFTHRVQPGETLAKIAARYFNDQHLFYALARLNNIKAPKSLAAGQVIRVPGRATAVSTPAASPSTPVVPVPASAVEPATPQPTAAQQKALIDKHAKAARTACIRQDLDTCIAQWAEVLKIEPNHPTALLEQPRAMRLRDKLRGITK